MRRPHAATGAWACGFLLWLVGLAGERGSIGIGWELAMLCGTGVLVSATLYRRWTC